jgi:hypothetical protein
MRRAVWMFVLILAVLTGQVGGQPYPVRRVRVIRPPVHPGLNTRMRVQAPTRLDWLFAAPAGSTAGALAGHDSTQVLYQLYVPRTYHPAVAHPLVLFISPDAVPGEAVAWELICRKYGVLYASAYGAGNNVPAVLRTRIVLDVLDDVRRRLHTDTDRIYLAGSGEGARLAARLAFSLPENVGGALCIGAGHSLRDEAWLRERARDRLSVALVAGELSAGRAELERYRLPVLEAAKVRSKLGLLPNHADTLPPPAVLEEALVWLEAGLPARQALTKRYPATRVPEHLAPSGPEWAKAIVDEAGIRVRDPKLRDSGLFQLAGVVERWPGTPGAREAERRLRDHNAKAGRKWEAVVAEAQQEHAHREASAFAAWLAGPLPAQQELLKPLLLREAVAKWEAVVKHGANTKLGKDAKARADALRRRLPAW